MGHDPGEKTRFTRRLSDKVLMAFEQACHENDSEAARDLLAIYEGLVRAKSASHERRKSIDLLVSAHEQLWRIRNEL
jgi:hypothetical protein